MTRHSSLTGLVMIAGLTVAGDAAAAPSYVDGSPVETTALCGANAQTGVVSKVGYIIDPVAETPQLHQVTYIHAVATNKNCVGDGVEFEFFLPPGASLNSASPVQCYTTAGPAAGCHPPTLGPNGGLVFGSQFLRTNESFEIQVPVIFSQQLVESPIVVTTWSGWGVTDAMFGVTAPFQPAPLQGTLGDDLALVGGSWSADTLPVAFSNDDGSFTVTNYPVGDFAIWARSSNVKRVTGDFNYDGLMDFALIGGSGWATIPVAMADGDGQFTITNHWVGYDFGTWAATANVKPLAGDFNRDGHTDIALVGGAGWSAVPIAFSTGSGTFTITNSQIANFAGWAGSPGARPLTGDFNRDGYTDIALVGGIGWNTLPVAFSYGNGTFLVTNQVVNYVNYSIYGQYGWNFATSSREANAQAVTGDFNKDGFTDIALVGGAGWSTIRLALSYGNGSFQLHDKSAGSFPAWASSAGAKVLTGDFNKDGFTDLALTGVSGWNTVPVAFMAGSYNVTVTNQYVGGFGSWASTAGARAIAGDFNGDGYTDIALTGGNWSSIPVAFSAGYGNFNVANKTTHRFPSWSPDQAATLVSGRMD